MKVFQEITPDLANFISHQHIFFVASAPLSAEGHINLSPKGLDCLRILSPLQVAYLDMIGSGNETSAHLQENGRITFMFCAFDGSPNIVRLYGVGRTILPGQPHWAELISNFPLRDVNCVRQIILADIGRVQTSCGFGVPLYEYQGERDTLLKWWEKKGPEEAQDYKKKNNLVSIDGLPSTLGANSSD